MKNIISPASTSTIMNLSKNTGVHQLLHENLTWERTLNFYLQENSFLKDRLSMVLQNDTDKEFVALAERFHNSLILTDDCITDLQKDISAQQKSLKDFIAGKSVDENKMQVQQKKLRNEMSYFDKDFGELKAKFNKFLVT